MPKLIRATTAPLSLKYLLRGQMRFMREKGFDVLMLSSDGSEIEDVKAYEGCPHKIIPMTRKITPIADLQCLWKLYWLFKKEKPDIVHSHTPKAGLLVMLASKFAGVKIRIHTVAGLRFVTMKGSTRKLLVKMEKLTSWAATHVWPNSFSLKQYMEANELADLHKLEVLGSGSSNGINLERYSPKVLDTARLRAIKEKIGFDPSLTYFVCVGRIVHDKGIDELLKAFIAVHKSDPSVRLILVGAFEDELDPISKEARHLLQTERSIIQPGWSDAVEYYMFLAFALVHPSHREGFPNVLLQAGAMNCPVICSFIDGNRDIVEQGATGLLFEAGNAKELQEQLEYALQNRSQLKEMAVNLRNKIERSYSHSVVCQIMFERYLQLLERNKGDNR